MRTRLLLLAALMVTVSMASGCFTILDENSRFDLANKHNSRLWNKMGSDMQEAHRDWDYIVFGVDTKKPEPKFDDDEE